MQYSSVIYYACSGSDVACQQAGGQCQEHGRMARPMTLPTVCLDTYIDSEKPVYSEITKSAAAEGQ